MKQKTANLSGMSFPYSISLLTDSGGSVEIDTQDKNEHIRYSKRSSWSVYKYVKDIPFVRGLILLLELITKFLMYLWSKKLFLFIGILVLGYILFAPRNEVIDTTPPNFFWDNYIGLGYYSFLIIFIFIARKNHGAEHKVISAYETSQNISLKNIKKQPKENRRCGTVLVMWMLVFLIPLDIFNIDIPFTFFIVFMVAYELFLLARKRNIFGNIAYSIGWLGQKLTTKEPDDNLLSITRKGIKKLLDEGRYYYSK